MKTATASSKHATVTTRMSNCLSGPKTSELPKTTQLQLGHLWRRIFPAQRRKERSWTTRYRFAFAALRERSSRHTGTFTAKLSLQAMESRQFLLPQKCESHLDRVSTGSGSDLVSDQHAN